MAGIFFACAALWFGVATIGYLQGVPAEKPFCIFFFATVVSLIKLFSAVYTHAIRSINCFLGVARLEKHLILRMSLDTLIAIPEYSWMLTRTKTGTQLRCLAE